MGPLCWYRAVLLFSVRGCAGLLLARPGPDNFALFEEIATGITSDDAMHNLGRKFGAQIAARVRKLNATLSERS